jgi:hypothetical protein
MGAHLNNDTVPPTAAGGQLTQVAATVFVNGVLVTETEVPANNTAPIVSVVGTPVGVGSPGRGVTHRVPRDLRSGLANVVRILDNVTPPENANDERCAACEGKKKVGASHRPWHEVHPCDHVSPAN